MKNVICLDLRKYSEFELRDICEKFTVSFDIMSVNKVKYHVAKAYIDLDSLTMFAYTLESDPDTLILKNEMIYDILNTIPVYAESPILYVDAILDKISLHGVESLTESEKSYLSKI